MQILRATWLSECHNEYQYGKAAAGGFQREAVPQACGLRNGLSGRQGGFYFPQRCGSRHEDLKKAAGRLRGFSGILPAVFVYGNLRISHSPYS